MGKWFFEKIKIKKREVSHMKNRILCICSTAAVLTGGVFLFNGCASTEDDRLPPGAYVPPAPKPNPPPIRPEEKGEVDNIEPAQPQPVVVTPAEEQIPPPPPPKKTVKEEKKEKKGTTAIHVVKKGDTLWKLAAAYGVSRQELIDANPGITPSKLYIGQKLMIPAHTPGKKVRKPASAAKARKTAGKKMKKTSVKVADGKAIYIVRKGDSISKIAAKYKINPADLAAANKLSMDKPLWVGLKLVIPKNTAKANKKAKQTKKNAAVSAKGRKKDAKKVAEKPAPEKQSGDAVSAPANPAAAPDASVPEPVLPPEPPVANDAAGAKTSSAVLPPPTASIVLDEDVSIEDYARKNGFTADVLKKYNPDIPADGIIRAGTKVYLP